VSAHEVLGDHERFHRAGALAGTNTTSAGQFAHHGAALRCRGGGNRPIGAEGQERRDLLAIRPLLNRERPAPEARFCARPSPWNVSPRCRSRPRTRRLRPCENPTASRPRSPKSDHPSRRPDRLTIFRPSRRRPPASWEPFLSAPLPRRRPAWQKAHARAGRPRGNDKSDTKFPRASDQVLPPPFCEIIAGSGGKCEALVD